MRNCDKMSEVVMVHDSWINLIVASFLDFFVKEGVFEWKSKFVHHGPESTAIICSIL